MDEAPATPPPTFSNSEEMETDEEADLLASPHASSSSRDDVFEHV